MEELAEVYARSLFEVAREQGKLDVLKDQLGAVADAISEKPELATFFFSPYFSTQEKKEGLAKAVTRADEALVNFLELLIEKHRMPALFRIRRRYDDLWAKENQLLPVAITSAVELDSKTVKAISDKIAERTGKEVELETSVEPDILGGLVVRVGNSILDASIRNRLEQLRKQVARG